MTEVLLKLVIVKLTIAVVSGVILTGITTKNSKVLFKIEEAKNILKQNKLS